MKVWELLFGGQQMADTGQKYRDLQKKMFAWVWCQNLKGFECCNRKAFALSLVDCEFKSQCPEEQNSGEVIGGVLCEHTRTSTLKSS